MIDFYNISEPYIEDSSAYAKSKRETVLNTIKPICEAFEIIVFATIGTAKIITSANYGIFHIVQQQNRGYAMREQSITRKQPLSLFFNNKIFGTTPETEICFNCKIQNCKGNCKHSKEEMRKLKNKKRG